MTPPVLPLKRRFTAPLHRVWQAFSTAEGLAAWMGPAQTQMQCLHFNLEVGGHLHYALLVEDAQPFYGRWDFLAVAPFVGLEYHLAFSDAQSRCVHHELAPDWPLQTLVQVAFIPDEDDTYLEITARPGVDSSEIEVACFAQSLEQLKANWQEAFTALDDYFAEQQACKR